MKLRILSYNIHRATGVDRLFRPERTAKTITHHDSAKVASDHLPVITDLKI